MCRCIEYLTRAHSKVSKYTACYAAHNAPVLYLCRSGIAVHAGQVRAGPQIVTVEGSDVFREMYLSACLYPRVSATCGAMALRHGDSTASIDIPVLLELREDLSLGMVADDSRVYETT